MFGQAYLADDGFDRESGVQHEIPGRGEARLHGLRCDDVPEAVADEQRPRLIDEAERPRNLVARLEGLEDRLVII